MQTLRPADSPEAYSLPFRSTSPIRGPLPIGLFLVCLPCLSFGSAVGVVVSLDLLARESVACIGLRLLCNRMVVAKHIWMVASHNSTSGPFRRTVLGGPRSGRGIIIDIPVYDKLMYAWTINDLPAATLSMTLVC